MTTDYEQLLALSTGLDPVARKYVVELLQEHRLLLGALKEVVDAPEEQLSERVKYARTVIAAIEKKDSK